jgi:hypothetical protein
MYTDWNNYEKHFLVLSCISIRLFMTLHSLLPEVHRYPINEICDMTWSSAFGRSQRHMPHPSPSLYTASTVRVLFVSEWVCVCLSRGIPLHTSLPAWLNSVREGKRVEKGWGQAPLGCHEEAAQTVCAGSARPCLVQQQAAVDIQQGDEAWTDICRPFRTGYRGTRGNGD